MRKILVLTAIACCAAMLPADQSSPQFLKKLVPDQQILHALDRLTFGPRPGDIEAVKRMGLSQWIDLQLHPERIASNRQLDAATAALAEPTSILAQARDSIGSGLREAANRPRPQDVIPMRQVAALRAGTAEQDLQILSKLPHDKEVQVLTVMPMIRQRVLPMFDADTRKMVEDALPPRPVPGEALGQAKFLRAVESDRQLEEVLVDFWYNHFNVDASKGADRYLVASYERDAIRPHLLGRFRDLLEATANSPAMMFYLDNWRSEAGKLNENYARELMELHTLGVDGGYTQQDIIEVARCFTGWSIQGPNLGGPFVYKDRTHDKGAKTVLGVTIPAGGGKQDGERVLDILARHPFTARFISRELAQRFVADDPPQALVDRMAKTFRDTDGDLRAVLSAMFNSPEFFSAGAYRAKIKTPFEMVTSAVRATGAKVDQALPLVKQVATMGEPLYRKQEPTGYSNLGSEWMNSAGLTARMNFAMDLTGNQLNGITVNAAKFSGAPSEAARGILFANASQSTLDAIGAQSDAAVVAGMLLGSPDFQRK